MAVLKLLKPGETDIHSTDAWRRVMDSSYPTFKIAQTGSANFTIPALGDISDHTVTHNLNKYPVYFASVLKGTRSYQVPAWMPTDIEVPMDGGGMAAVAFYSILDDLNTLRIGAYLPYGYAANNETFTASWIITLDEF